MLLMQYTPALARTSQCPQSKPFIRSRHCSLSNSDSQPSEVPLLAAANRLKSWQNDENTGVRGRLFLAPKYGLFSNWRLKSHFSELGLAPAGIASITDVAHS